MVPNLLETKLHPPCLPSRRIQRTKLIDALTEDLQAGRVLTLVSAPAGFGKTTVVSEWAGSLHLPIAWLSLDRADDDPGRFFAYLIAALQKIDASIGREIEGVLRSGQLPPLAAIAASLVNDILAAGVPFLLVLDDFQVIQDPATLQVLEAMLANPPAQLHLVLITREDPPLPLSRLRANDQMTEIRAADLRFSEREVDRFLNGVMGLCLSGGDIAAMEKQTEGWAAGLQLAALAMQDRPDPAGFIAHLGGTYRYILSYLTEEVLGRQAEDIQAFLLQTSILDRLCAELCDAVTGRTDSRALLEKCLHANLFLLPLDDEGRWYRYHHLFRDLLLNQHSRLSKGDIAGLHRGASLWYEGAGMTAEAIDHALAAADYQHAVDLLEEHAPGMIMQGHLKTVEAWMQALPAEWQSQNPRANLAFAWMHVLRGSYDRVFPYLELAGNAIRENGTADPADRAVRAEWLSLQSTMLSIQARPRQGIKLARQALRLAGPRDYYVRSLAYTSLGGALRLTGDSSGSMEAFQTAVQNSRAGGHLVPEMLAVASLMGVAIQHGRLHFAYGTGLESLERMEREGAQHSPMAGAVHSTLGLICYEWNRLEEAASHLSRGVQLSGLSGHNAGVVYARICHARLLQAQGDLQAASSAIQEVVDLLPLGLPAWMRPEVASRLVRFYLERGNAPAAGAVLSQLEISPEESVEASGSIDPAEALTHQEGLKCLLALRLMLHRGEEGRRPAELQRGIELAGRLVSRAMPQQRIEIVLQALLLRARMAALQGNMQASLADLRQALELAEPEGYARTFLDEGPEIARLLRLSLPHSAHMSDQQEDFIRQLLASYPAPGPCPETGEAPGVEDRLIEPLTDREMDVMKLMAGGLKYQEIAGQLVISLNTVRFYVKQIYGKLNVNNRTQAIEAARRHHIF